jgi:heme exporter protein A
MDTNTSKNDMTVYENIKFWQHLFASPIQDNEIDALLEMLNIQYCKNTFVKHLSYGEKRKLEISRLVVEKKKLWIFDEPYLGLDEKTINIFNETLKNHTRTEGMVIFSSHYHLEIQGVDTIDLEHYANI